MKFLTPNEPTPNRDQAPSAPTSSSTFDYPTQVIIYLPDGPTVLDTKATRNPDGSIVIDLPLGDVPPAGTPIQIVIYGPDGPIVIEGPSTAPDADGRIGIAPPMAPSASTEIETIPTSDPKIGYMTI